MKPWTNKSEGTQCLSTRTLLEKHSARLEDKDSSIKLNYPFQATNIEDFQNLGKTKCDVYLKTPLLFDFPSIKQYL